MNSQQDVIYGLMNELEEALDKGFPLLGCCFTVVKKDTVTNILDKLYNKVFTKYEKITEAAPSSNAIEIPEQYLNKEVKTNENDI